MKKLNVLIPSAGGLYLHINFIKEHPDIRKVITTEINPLAPGVYAADKCYKAPRTLSPKFFPYIIKLCEKEAIDVVIPLMDLDLMIFSKNRTDLERIGIKLLLPPPEVIKLTEDKYKTNLTLRNEGFPVPASSLFSEIEQDFLHYPLILKPRYLVMKNSSEYFIKVLRSKTDLSYYKEKLKGK